MTRGQAVVLQMEDNWAVRAINGCAAAERERRVVVTAQLRANAAASGSDSKSACCIAG